MSDATPSKGVAKWTEEEKLGLIFQIVAKMGGSIPWDDLELPEGRTRKACQVMIDREKSKVKAPMGGAIPATPASGKKRSSKAAGIDDETPSKKKKTPARKKKAAKAVEDDDEEVTKGEESPVKAEASEEFV